MGATLELKFFNSYWLKKLKTINAVVGGQRVYASNVGTTFVITVTADATVMNVGQSVTFSYVDGSGNDVDYIGYIVSIVSTTSFIANVAPSPAITGTPTITFGSISNFDNIPRAYANTNAEDWFIEESRIRGGYNNLSTDIGVKAHIVEDNPNNQNRFSSLIYSGVFNSRTGVNQTNEFSVGEDITRSLDPAKGSIQKLFAEDTNLIIFQEDKVSRALIDKDAIYSAEGGAITTAGSRVIGQVIPYAGEYGISKDPFSFAVYGFRKYFTDRKRACVLRLSTSGEMIEISSYGMSDYFRDKLTQNGITKIRGGWDMHTKNYILSIQTASSGSTINFDESVQGWTSFISFDPTWMFSLAATFFSTNAGKMYEHHVGEYGKFYTNNVADSNVTVILNQSPSTVKVFKTINYEGGGDWKVSSLVASSGDIALVPINRYVFAQTPTDLSAQLFQNSFKKKEQKYFANILNNSSAANGEVVFGASMTGVKGFYNEVVFTLDNGVNGANNQKRELFAVSSDTVESSY
tara:strand:+ start:6552 stop:8111 length:1560 start_codon:yes stop_codon:yes gene_type:complete